MNAPTPADAPPTRRRRLAPLIAVPVALVMVLLVILLATRDPASERLAKSPLVGKQAPPIEGVTLANEPFTLDRVRGEWVVVNFFGSWCTPCIQEHPELVSFQNAHRGARDATVVSVAFADSPTGLVVAKLIGGVTEDRLDSLIAKYSAPAPTASTPSTR